MDLVSIITPTYQSEKYIRHTIDAIINQSYTNWELLITDDASTDSTINIIKSYIDNDSRIKLFNLSTNSGVAIARNNSLKNATGRFIAFCDSDDIWSFNKLQDQINFMISNNYYFTYTHYNYFYNTYTLGKLIISPNRVNYNKILKNNYIGCSTVIYDNNVVKNFSFPLMKKRQDWAMWISILSKVDYAYCYPFSLTFYRIHNSSLSGNKFKLIIFNYNVYNQYLKFNHFKAIVYLIRFLFFYFKFKIFSK
jgi:teichuronic acid biosynthesis glycosyltransferase TuaG